jgi:hypothetical protein
VLGDEIDRYHNGAMAKTTAALEDTIAAGERLIEAKSLIKHGEWLPWLRDKRGMSARTASRYMRRALHRQIGHVADLNNLAVVEEEGGDAERLALGGDIMTALAEYGVTEQELQEWRALSDVERASPGIVRRVLDDLLVAGQGPTREALNSGIMSALAALAKRG